jgi:uncharacterized UPF0160 family protein
MFKIFKKKLKLVTHNGSFHADDIFAAATLSLYLEKLGQSFEIIRTRDEKIIESADYVFDVGGVYDADKNRFDHHQKGGAGDRKIEGSEGKESINIEYASIGLVWKKFGVELCDNQKAADIIDQKLITPLDAVDNGIDLVINKSKISPYSIQQVFSSMRPTWREENITNDEMFFKCLEIAKKILIREIINANDIVLAEEQVLLAYKNAQDKRIIVLDNNYPFEYFLHNFPEPLYVIYPRKTDNSWGIKAVVKELKTFINRKDFPKSWAGLRNEDLQKVTGVNDAMFCHLGLYFTVAKSKEGAIKLAQIAVGN